MEIFKFKFAHSGKCFDIKLLGIEEKLTIEYEIIRPIINHKRVLFHALVNGQIEIVDLPIIKFREMINLMMGFSEKHGKNFTDGCYIRLDVNNVVGFPGRVQYEVFLIPSDLYDRNSKEVKDQIREFKFTLDDAMSSIKDTYSKNGHWSEKIKIR